MTHNESDQTVEAQSGQPEPKRVMGPKLLLLFIIGDILGTGIYALTGDVAAEVGGAAWLPFLVAFAVATVTAMSYLELVTKYPQAAGAALYTQKAFGRQSLTFLVAFVVMCVRHHLGGHRVPGVRRQPGSRFRPGHRRVGHRDAGPGFPGAGGDRQLPRGRREREGQRGAHPGGDVRTALVIAVGLFAAVGGRADLSRVVAFETPGDKGWFLALTTATSLAFFAMIGFEDSVNMAEETKDPVHIFPRVMLTGLCITGLIYVLVSVGVGGAGPGRDTRRRVRHRWWRW